MRAGAVGVLFAVASAGCATSTAYLAKVNDETITGKELRQEFARHHYAMDRILVDEPAVRKYVERLAERRLFVQEGYRMGLGDAPEVREVVAQTRALKESELFLKDEMARAPPVTDADVKTVYDGLNVQIEARQIVVRTREEADAILASLGKGASFEALARERSVASSARRGGLIQVGWGGDEARERALFPLKEGETSPVFESGEGWEVAIVEKRVLVDQPSFEKAGPLIRNALERRRRANRERDLTSFLWTQYQAKLLDCAATFEALQAAGEKKDPTPCAKWRGGILTAQEFASRVKLDDIAAMRHAYPRLRKSTLEDLVTRDLVKAEAEARGYALRPEVVDQAKVQQDDAVETLLYRDYVTKGIAVTEEDARGYYQAHKASFVEDDRYELAHIVVDTPELAAEVERKVRSRQPFEELAAAYSKDRATADKGGAVGPVAKGQLRDDLAPVAKLGEGEVSAPIHLSSGYHLVKVVKVVPGRQLPFEEAKEQARDRALQERREAAKERWMAQLRAAGRIEVNEAGIRAFERQRREELERENAARAAAPVKAAGGHGGMPAGTQGAQGPATAGTGPKHDGPVGANPANTASPPAGSAPAPAAPPAQPGGRQ